MKDHYGQNATYVVVDCDCGTKGLELPLRRILDNNTRSCGCLQSEIQSERAIERNYKHGKGNLEYRLYREWCAMKGRCYTASSTNFQHWGGKGVTVCNEWREDFEIFEKWALENGYTDKLTIERKDVNGHYEPSNCKWITLAEQQLNKTNSVLITAWGETKNLTTWGRDPRCKIDYRMIKWRIDNGWDAETAISKPPQG
jgi:hypothetical protein